MAILNDKNIIIEAVLTDKGREALARNDGSFNITKFSLSDDEVNYNLYNENHPNGSEFFGEEIEKLPLLEAFYNENESMKYKLLSLPKGTQKIPIIVLGYEEIVLKLGDHFTMTPKIKNYEGDTLYVFKIIDSRFITLLESDMNDKPEEDINYNSSSLLIKGNSFTFKSTELDELFGNNTEISTNIELQEINTGASINILLKLKKNV